MDEIEDTLEVKPVAPSAPYVLLGCGWMMIGAFVGTLAGVVYAIMDAGGWTSWYSAIRSTETGPWGGTVGGFTEALTIGVAFYAALGGAAIGLIIGLIIAFRRRHQNT